MTTNRTLPENTKPPRLIDQLAEQASAADSTQYDERAAQQLFNKGMAYFKGVGVKRHDGMALSFWRKAADMGHAEACNAVGYMLELGRGTSKNAAGAVANYRKAAQMLNLNGKYNLGRCYARGIGTEKDEHSAADNLKYAAYRGQTAANIELTQLTGEAGSFLGNLFGNLFIAVILFALGSACLMGGFALNKQDAQRKEIARRLDSEGVRVQAEVVGLSANKFRGAKTYSFDVGVVFFDGDYKAVRTSVPVEPDFGQSIRDNQINKIDVKYLPDDPKVAKSVSGALKESLLMMILAATGIGIGFLIGGVTFLRLRPNKSPGPIGPL